RLQRRVLQRAGHRNGQPLHLAPRLLRGLGDGLAARHHQHQREAAQRDPYHPSHSASSSAASAAGPGSASSRSISSISSCSLTALNTLRLTVPSLRTKNVSGTPTSP